MQRQNVLHLLPTATLLILSASVGDGAEPVRPGKTWATTTPAEVKMDVEGLKEFSRFVGGRGCVIRHGYMVYSWGDVSRRADVASAAKPFYSHFLFKAVETGRVESLDEKLVRWETRLGKINEQLSFKDRDIAWRHGSAN